MLSVSMYVQTLVKFHQFVLKILSGNEILTSIKGHNSVIDLRILTRNNPNQDLVNVNAYANFVKFHQFVLKLLSGNEILTSIKGHNSVTNLWKLTSGNAKLEQFPTYVQIQSIRTKMQFWQILDHQGRNNPSLDLININA